jgi:hypothetical protein
VLYILNYGIYSKSKNADLAGNSQVLNTEKPQVTNVQSGMAVAVLEKVNSTQISS